MSDLSKIPDPSKVSDLSKLKEQIRSEALSRRDALSVEMRTQYSDEIAEHFKDCHIAPNGIVSAFLPIRSEVDLKPIISRLWTRKADVCLPYILSKTEIEFREFLVATKLVGNGFGTLAPDDASQVRQPDVMLVPLSAFDAMGGRIGYGGGFYDRAIEKLKAQGKAQTLIGVAFSTQEVDLVPTGPHDVPLDFILTERGLREF